MENNIDEIFDREHDRMHGMIEMLTDYLDTIDNSEVPETYSITKWVAAEMIIFLASHVGETHYEMIGILDECKDDLRKRSLNVIRENRIEDNE
jgi:hypothetical protein